MKTAIMYHNYLRLSPARRNKSRAFDVTIENRESRKQLNDHDFSFQCFPGNLIGNPGLATDAANDTCGGIH